MADVYDVLTDVKSALGITGNYQDNTLKIYIRDVKHYLYSAGIPVSRINSKASAGVIARGVSDLWNYGAGEGKLSSYFYERVVQIAIAYGGERPDDDNFDEYATDEEINNLFK